MDFLLMMLLEFFNYSSIIVLTIIVLNSEFSSSSFGLSLSMLREICAFGAYTIGLLIPLQI